MTPSQSFSRMRLLGALLIVILVAAACVSPRIDVSWASMTTLGDNQNIFVAFKDRVLQISPINGAGIPLLNSQGEERVDEQGNVRTWVVSNQQVEGAQFFSAPLLIEENTLLLPAYNERLYTVDLSTARVNNTNGEAIPGGVITNAAYVDNVYYLPLIHGGVVAMEYLGEDQFTEKWHFELDDGVWSAPLVADGVVYFGAIDHNLYALDAETGEELWRVNLEGGIGSTPRLYNDRLYVGSFSRKLFVISLNGEIVDEFSTDHWIWGTPAIAGNTAYIAGLGGSVYALDISDDLNLIWRKDLGGRGIRANPLVYEDIVLVASRDGLVYWLDRNTGEEIFNRNLEVELLADPLLIEPSEEAGITDAMVVIATTDINRLLVAYQFDNGLKLWTHPR